jgi:hypothetical protein
MSLAMNSPALDRLTSWKTLIPIGLKSLAAVDGLEVLA